MVLGNFLAAVLVRNEVFGRFLYAIVNNCFAKVRIFIFVWVIKNDVFNSGHRSCSD